MRARAWFVFLVVMLAGGIALAGERVASYAYITGIQTDYASAANEGIKEDHCDVTARLPLDIVTHRPSGPAPELRKDATLAYSRESDADRICNEWLHTWQPVTFDPDDRKDVEFDLPKDGGLTGSKIIGIIIGVILIWSFLKERYGQRLWDWRMKRRTEKEERLRKSIDELHDRIAARQKRDADAAAQAHDKPSA